MRNSERKAGIWTVTFKATENGEGYSGPADVTTVSGDRVRKNRIYFNRGEAKIKYNGFNFGV